MFMLWPVAHELGIDAEFGLNFEIHEFASADVANISLARGDLDIVGSAISFHLAAVQGAPQLIGFSSLSIFNGFIFVGRAGEVVPYATLVEDMGADAAWSSRLNEFKGKGFCIVPQNRALLADTLSQVNLTLDDVTVYEFADDPTAAAAFEQGTGDFYIGSLPEEQRLLGMPDKFVNAGGSEILGPTGLWYDLMITTEDFMDNNQDVALRIIAAMYKTINLFNSDRQQFAELAAAELTSFTGTAYTADDYIAFQTVYDNFLTISDLQAGMYNPDSPLYWKNPVQYNINLAVEQGTLSHAISADDYYGKQIALFNELLTRQDLMTKIGS
jgi:ABC-type nitrate/sulfonate/bicarbonate transport system substrate-binding protein